MVGREEAVANGRGDAVVGMHVGVIRVAGTVGMIVPVCEITRVALLVCDIPVPQAVNISANARKIIVLIRFLIVHIST